jgi:indolepyruvate ferredoxin oxidoreductase beta subunit
MKYDVILAGVGGQGVLSIAVIIAQAAAAENLAVRQSEVHGMAQRGGTVLAHLRLSSGHIAGDLVPRGCADLIVSMEPLESLRYAAWLSPDGALVTSAEAFININDYPGVETVLAAVRTFPRHALVFAGALAKQASLPRAANIVMAGAASRFLPLKPETLETAVGAAFVRKDPALIQANVTAFHLGRESVPNPRK